MNIPTKVLRSTFITYETYFHHQQLAKRYYKSSNKIMKKLSKQSGGYENEKTYELEKNEQITYVISEPKQNYKDEIMKW